MKGSTKINKQEIIKFLETMEDTTPIKATFTHTSRVYANTSKPKALPWFKKMLVAFEKSNPECFKLESFNGNEQQLVGLSIGIVLREEEYLIKVHNMLVLNGPQGMGKSTFGRRLSKGFFSESLTITDMGKKESVEKCEGAWFVEVPEIHNWSK